MADKGDKLVAGGSPTWQTLAAFSPGSTAEWGREVAERTDAAARMLGLTPQSAAHIRAALVQAVKNGVPGSTLGQATCCQICILLLGY
jgi:hypothetical protein